MTFAQIPKEAILYLKGLRFHLFAIVQMEMFESGEGVCKLTARELAEKYPALGNYDSLCRYRKALIKDGWLIEAVGGVITKSFNNTDILSVETENETDEISVTDENTDEISVEQEKPLIKYQSDTDEISGTKVALNDLDFKDNLSLNTHNARARDSIFPVKELIEAFPFVEFTPSDFGFIKSAVTEKDKAAWLATIQIYKLNHKPEMQRYMPNKIGNLLNVFENQKAQLARQNGGNQNGIGNGKNYPAQTSGAKPPAVGIDTSRVKRPTF